MEIEKLTKEGFWDLMIQRYPVSSKIFLDWIDQYKKRVNWLPLFNSSSDWQDNEGRNAPAPKFHNIPPEMQFGIFLQFIKEHHWEYLGDITANHLLNVPKLINDYFYLDSVNNKYPFLKE